jgi:TrmH family RNA methyltransferase
VAVRLGAHADRLSAVRALSSAKGRRETGRFAFEGATLLEEARVSGVHVDEIFVTQESYDGTPIVREFESAGTAVFVVEPRSMAKISDLEAPPGIVAVGPIRLAATSEIFGGDGLVLILADLNDPGNTGTLLRSAEAFGCRGVVAGRLGADPYQPKVVRAAMGALLRLPVAVADPEEVAEAARPAGFDLAGLASEGEPLERHAWRRRTALVVGHERRGLARWEGLCSRRLAIPMRGSAESLNAAIAGSIALYEAAKSPPD